jgi:hypothetical protein
LITDRSDQLPKARTEKLIIKELADETLVYDLERDQAHCLNSTSAFVWKNCDGEITVREIAQLLGRQEHTDVDESVIWLALDQLETFHLLESTVVKPSNLSGLSRRQLVKKVGFAALALPVIVSIAAPTAHAQVSCPPPGCATPGCIPTGCPCSPNGRLATCAGGNCTGTPGTCS